jgi:probable F420-dependent oxidoreductase
MREVILAMRAFWDCWQNGTRLNFKGEFFNLSLMTPFFNPGPHPYPDIPVHIAGINRLMCQLAGELCQGFHVHPLHTARYIEEFALPHIQQGLEKSGRRRSDIELYSSIFVIPTDDPEATRYEAEVRQQISFYASTPPYRVILELHGWQEAGKQLSGLAAQGKWAEMPSLITDDMLDTFAVRGSWAELPARIKAKYAGGLLDRVSYYMPFAPGQNDDKWRATIAGFKT